MSRTRADVMDPETATLPLLDESGQPHPLHTLWSRGTAVIVFLRHFGWLFCREQAVQLHREAAAAIQARGASLHLVGIGLPTAIEGFRDDTGVTAPIYADPTFATYRALGMRRGASTFLSLGFLRHAWRAMRAGFRNVGIAGDTVQQGGVLVVHQDGTVSYRYLSGTAGDHPPVRDILAAL